MSATLAVSILTILATLVNSWLCLRIRNEILESERRVMDYVDGRYRLAAVCEARMAGLEHRLDQLEHHKHAPNFGGLVQAQAQG